MPMDRHEAIERINIERKKRPSPTPATCVNWDAVIAAIQNTDKTLEELR